MRRASPPASSKRRTICWAGRRRDRVRGDLQHVLGRPEGLNWLPRGILAAGGIVVGSTPRPTPPPRPPARAAPGAPRLIRRPPSCCWCHRLRGDRSASRAAWTAARVTLSGPDVLVKLAYLYSNPLPGPETPAELRDRAAARLRPANHLPMRQVGQPPPREASPAQAGPARIEELITA